MLKLESLKKNQISNLNSFIGGANGMDINRQSSFSDTCRCVKGSGCSVYIWPDGTPMATGGDWYED